MHPGHVIGMGSVRPDWKERLLGMPQSNDVCLEFGFPQMQTLQRKFQCKQFI